MKVTITDPKQKKEPLILENLVPGTLFTMDTKSGEFYIGLIVRSEYGNGSNVVRLNGSPVYTTSVSNSYYKKESVTIIKTVELSTE